MGTEFMERVLAKRARVGSSVEEWESLWKQLSYHGASTSQIDDMEGEKWCNA